MKIDGLPEGVEVVRIGIPKADEFELYGETITKGARGDSLSQVVVKPADGWAFKWDIYKYHYVPVKLLAKPQVVSVMMTFRVENEQEKSALMEHLEKAKDEPVTIPACASMTVTVEGQ